MAKLLRTKRSGNKRKTFNTSAARKAEFRIARVFDAPRELVFKAWTDPKRLALWWGPSAFTTPACDQDARPGGAYRLVMRSPGGVDYPLTGVYREVVDPERLVLTQDVSAHPASWHDMINERLGRRKGGKPVGEMVMAVSFADAGGKTRLSIRTAFKSAPIRDAMVKIGMREGWSQSLDRLAELLTADREIATTRVVDAPRERVLRAWNEPGEASRWRGPDAFPSARLTATFEALNGRTKVTMRILFPSAADRDAAVENGGAVEKAARTLQALADHLAKA